MCVCVVCECVSIKPLKAGLVFHSSLLCTVPGTVLCTWLGAQLIFVQSNLI